MSIFSARSITAALLTLFAFFTVAHASSDDMSQVMKHEMSHEIAMPMAQSMAAEVYQGHGVVKKITANSISIAHQPIAALNWPAMTMTFSLPEAGVLPVVKVGDTVDFTFSQHSEGYKIASVTPTK